LSFYEYGPFKLDQQTSGCVAEGGTCDYKLSFTPSMLGYVLSEDIEVLSEQGGDHYALQAEGTGVSPVPLPGDLPLALTAVAGLGFARRFRRRKA
jgi:hypothetical protein